MESVEQEKRLRHTWENMRYRCYGKHLSPRTAKAYRDKGITVCDSWKNNFNEFYAWAILNGYETGLSIDRIDATKGYAPDNCRWVSIKENNGRRTIEPSVPKGFDYASVDCKLLGQNLSRLQAEHGESNYRLAKELGVSQTTIANWKSGQIKPLAVYAEKIAAHFGVSVDELMADEPEQT